MATSAPYTSNPIPASVKAWMHVRFCHYAVLPAQTERGHEIRFPYRSTLLTSRLAPTSPTAPPIAPRGSQRANRQSHPVLTAHSMRLGVNRVAEFLFQTPDINRVRAGCVRFRSLRLVLRTALRTES